MTTSETTERAIFDIRVCVEGEDRTAVWTRIYELLQRAQESAPEGVAVRYVQMRPANRSKTFVATMSPSRSRAGGEDAPVRPQDGS